MYTSQFELIALRDSFACTTPTTTVLNDIFREAQADVVLLTRTLADLKSQIEVERSGSIVSIAETETEIQKAQFYLDKLRTKLERTKSRSKKHKGEIQDLAERLSRVIDDHFAVRVKLKSEMEWRVSAIGHLEAKISQLYNQMRVQEGLILSLELRQEVIQQGALERPIEEDPRILALQIEIEDAKQLLAAHT